MTLVKRTALVTGANRGIGLAVAQALLKEHGCKVVASARTWEDAKATAEKLGGDSIPAVLDLSKPDTLREATQRIIESAGHVEILINNAGILTDGNGLEITAEALEESLLVNAVSPFSLIQIFGSAMKAQGWGRIVNVSSQWGAFEQGLTGPAAYSISKATLNAVTLTFAQSLGNSVKVNSACPGWVRTRMGGEGATNSPEEGADTPVWLATLPDDGPTGGFFSQRRRISW